MYYNREKPSKNTQLYKDNISEISDKGFLT